MGDFNCKLGQWDSDGAQSLFVVSLLFIHSHTTALSVLISARHQQAVYCTHWYLQVFKT